MWPKLQFPHVDFQMILLLYMSLSSVCLVSFCQLTQLFAEISPLGVLLTLMCYTFEIQYI